MSTSDDLNISNVGSYDRHTHPLITAMYWFLMASPFSLGFTTLLTAALSVSFMHTQDLKIPEPKAYYITKIREISVIFSLLQMLAILSFSLSLISITFTYLVFTSSVFCAICSYCEYQDGSTIHRLKT